MYSQRQVLQAFLEHRSAKASNLISTGDSLLSYGWYELAKWVSPATTEAQDIRVRTGPLPSQSTKVQYSKLGLYRWTKANNPTPVYQGYMND